MSNKRKEGLGTVATVFDVGALKYVSCGGDKTWPVLVLTDEELLAMSQPLVCSGYEHYKGPTNRLRALWTEVRAKYNRPRIEELEREIADRQAELDRLKGLR